MNVAAMEAFAIQFCGLGKCYKLYPSPRTKVLDAFGLLKFFPWKMKHVRPFWALRDISLTVGRGERLGLIGRNGAGKSTLLKLICGNVQATEGQVTVNGQVQALMEMGTGFHPEFTGRENIRASLAYHSLSKAAMRACEEDIEDFVELDHFLDQPVKYYSAGMYARLAFASATAVKPDILIIDEILGAGDAYFASKCAERMKALTHAAGTTLLFVSHDLSSVQQMCDRAVWIDRGQIVMDASPLEVSKAYFAETLRLEEKRRTLRNRRQVGSQSAIQPDVLLYRLVASHGGEPECTHIIHHMRLKGTDIELTVFPGAPMDNDCSQTAAVISGSHTCWGEPVVTEWGFRRPVMPTGGLDKQAPFQFVHEELKGTSGLCLEIRHNMADGEELAVELYDGEKYNRLGLLSHGNEPRLDIFPLGLAHATGEAREPEQPKIPAPRPTASNSVSEAISSFIPGTTPADPLGLPPENPEQSFYRIKESGDKFSSSHARIISVDIQGEKGTQSVFSYGESIYIKVDLEVFKVIPEVYFAMAIYTEANTVYAGDWLIGEYVYPQNINFTFQLISPPLRQKEYILSFALIDVSTAHDVPKFYYSEWNRTHTLLVNEDYIGKMPLGLIKIKTVPERGAPIYFEENMHK